MYPDDYLSSYEIIEEADGRAKLRSKIKAIRCKHCDQDSVQSNGTVKKTVYDIDSRTGEMITIEVEHYRYRCKNPDCKESFTLDVLPFKCFPDTPSDGRTNKSRSRDILNSAMDYLLLGSDENGNPITVSAAAKKFGYDRKVIATELHARVNAAIEEHVSSNETCAQAAIVPFIYRGVMRCAYIGYIQKDGAEELIPVLYDIRDEYNQEDLEKYLTEHRHQGVVVPEVTYLDMDETIINMVLNLYVEEYQAKKSKKTGETDEDSFFFGTVKDIVRKKTDSIEGPELPNEFGIRDSFRYYKAALNSL